MEKAPGWKKWFAWYPVRLYPEAWEDRYSGGKVVWLVYVEYMETYSCGDREVDYRAIKASR